MTARPKVDFAKIDFEQGWHRPEGAPEGVSVKILAGALDHVAKQGHCTTLTRWRAGTEVTQAITHDYIEEVPMRCNGSARTVRRRSKGTAKFAGPPASRTVLSVRTRTIWQSSFAITMTLAADAATRQPF